MKQQRFSPNNLEVSKYLFTGRTADLENIFKLILSGNCVALYGERRIGKSLTLWMIQAIINGDIEAYEEGLIDEKLRAAIPVWREKLTGHKAILVEVKEKETEEELLGRFRYGLQTINIQPFPKRLDHLLDTLQDQLSTSNQRLVILLDEMGRIESLDNGVQIAGLLCDRNRYSRIIFVHAGAYQWWKHVSSSDTVFRDLEPYYLKSIDEDDMVNFLLKPLPRDNMKRFVAEMSGSKPLYAQYIGKDIYEQDITIPEDGLESRLLKNDSLCLQIERSIYEEKELDDDSKRILAALVYHPRSTVRWIAMKLKLSKAEAKKRLAISERFGVVSRSGGKYQIVGKLIERYGKEICDDPCRRDSPAPPKSYIQHTVQTVRWIMMIIMLFLSLSLYLYTHPSKNTRKFDFPSGRIIFEVPGSLENGEEGELDIYIATTGAIPIDSLKLLFNSDCVLYKNEKGQNSVSFSNVGPGDKDSRTISYRVLSTNDSKLKSELTISHGGKLKKHPLFVSRRILPLKHYSPLLSIFLSGLGLVIPGRSWASVLAIIKRLLPDKSG